MMFYEQLSRPSTGEETWFDAPIEPKLRLTQAQRKVIASLCEQFLFGFRNDAATEHERPTCEPTTAAKHLTLLSNVMQPILQLRAHYFPEEKKLAEDEVSQVYTEWMHKWIDTQLRPDQQNKK